MTLETVPALIRNAEKSMGKSVDGIVLGKKLRYISEIWKYM
jgi:hypothetical protein